MITDDSVFLNRLQWDESNLTLHEIEREQQEARMKIDEPKTPFVRGSSLETAGLDDSIWSIQVTVFRGTILI